MIESLTDRRLTPVINLSGPLTKYGSSISSPAVARAAGDALLHHWDMNDLNRYADEVIARWSGAGAGMLTSSSASGVTLTVAACMTGSDLGRIEQLPDPTGMKREVVIQKGHSVNFGAPIEQMIRLAGAKVREVGTINRTSVASIEHALTPDTAAAMFVISHHTVQYGFVQLSEFVELCHAHDVPVIVDADLVRAVELQSYGIGRTMKIGKEGIFGTIAALEERMATDLTVWEAEQREKAAYLADQLQDLPGVAVTLEKDKVGQPVTRVRLEVDPLVAGMSAEAICDELPKCSPPIEPRAHHTDEGWFLLEPVHVTKDEMDYVGRELRRILS